MSRSRIHVFISGQVQGVFFRKNTKREANKRNLDGWVRNLDDGRVEAVFEGEESKLDEMTDWCGEGSRLAEVENVEVNEENTKEDLDGFKIRR